MSSKFEVLIDSDALIGRFFPDDPHNNKSTQLFEDLEDTKSSVVTTSLVVIEVATVLSHKANQALAKTFVEVMNRGNLPIIHITQELQQSALKVFVEQTQKGSSVVDCVNVVVMKKFRIPQIFSFDKIYAKKFSLDVFN